jgi:hypothetical protein
MMRRDPRSVSPRGIVPHMLLVPAFQFRDPVAVFVNVKSNDCPFHHRSSTLANADDAHCFPG